MPVYSQRSLDNLQSCDADLQTIFNEVIKYFDHSIIEGYRTLEKQFEHYKVGREYINKKWVKTGGILTNIDGITKKGKHNFNPSKAIHAVPYYRDKPHIRWKNTERMYLFAGYVMGIANVLRNRNIIDNFIRFGGDWDMDTEVKDQTFNDLIHFEIIQ